MITEQDLKEAIAECAGQRNPNANTAIKLAAYYIILDHLHEDQSKAQDSPSGYSFASGYDMIQANSDSDFSKIISGKNTSSVMKVIDDLMDALSVMYPRLYQSTLEKLKELNGV